MAGPQGDAENLYLVRRYSEVVRGEMVDEPLSQGLAVKVDLDLERERKVLYRGSNEGHVWRRWVGSEIDILTWESYESICATKLPELESKSLELQETWGKFKDKLKLGDGNDKGEAQIQMYQNSKVGKVKTFFGKSAQSLDNYNYLFDLLPSRDKYTSVFTGTFSTIVNATTVTHEKIANEMSDGFDEISDQVRSFYFVIRFHPRSAYIKYHIALFYFELFGFLVCIMREWYQSSWRRFSKSLGSTFLENTFQGTLKTLGLYTKRVEAEHKRWSTELIFQQLCALRAIIQTGLADQAKMQKAKEEEYANLSAYVKKDLPVKIAEIVLKEGSLRTKPSMGPPPLAAMRKRAIADVGPQNSEALVFSQNAVPKWSRDSVLAEVVDLKPYLQTAADVNKLIDLSRSIAVDTEISIRVHRWVTNTSSEALWIEGPRGVSQPSHSTLTSAFILGSLRRIGIPAMLEFCHYDPKYWRTWEHDKAFLKVIYALIYQAAKVIPERLEPELVELNFSSDRFQKLNGDVGTLPDAIKLLADLITVGPPLQFCIIDGLQLFDGRRLSELVRMSLKNSVAVLCMARAEASGKEKVVKVLFTTDGLVGELADSAKAKLLSQETYDNEDEDDLLIIKDKWLIK